MCCCKNLIHSYTGGVDLAILLHFIILLHISVVRFSAIQIWWYLVFFLFYCFVTPLTGVNLSLEQVLVWVN